MMGELIVRNLLHRPLRTLIGVLAVAVEVALVVLIVGLTSGLLTETAKRIEGIGRFRVYRNDRRADAH
jgi:putative ABC transport system permease protein